MQGIKQARQMLALLGGAVPPAAPSAALRRRILASVGGTESRFGWSPFLGFALALALFAAVYFGGRERDLANELARVRETNRQQSMELASINQAFTILTGADTVVSTFGEGKPTPKGKVFVSPTQGVLLIAGNLPPAPAGKAYEMWIIKDGKARAAGMFQTLPDGSGMHIQRGVAENTDAVAVTLENEGGSDQPTSTPLFAAPIRALLH